MKGRYIVLFVVEDSSILAFSAASLILCKMTLSLNTSISGFCSLNLLIKNFSSLLSKSSPPKFVFPLVALTSKTPSGDNSKIDISNVPPPKSYTAIILFLSLEFPFF